ncbi:MAG: hypothetical protein M1503_04235 [Thaumarchaeota archaeon]|nr:hypothetical protein [Nitrososphaerota archaeon]MCL5317461.1 hypothetical protein [Nitrososphaerota archaeon]
MRAAAIPVKGVDVDAPTSFMEHLRTSAIDAVAVQAVDARFVADLSHLWAVVRQAWTADKRRISRAKFDIEILLRVACDSRVANALATVGLKKGRFDVIFIVVGKEGALKRIADVVSQLGEVSEDLLILTPEKEAALRKHHGIEDKTLESTLQSRNNCLSGILAERATVALLHR